MAKFIEKVEGYSIYELDLNECVESDRVFPTFVSWRSSDTDLIGNMDLTENETETLADMEKWCKRK